MRQILLICCLFLSANIYVYSQIIKTDPGVQAGLLQSINEFSRYSPVSGCTGFGCEALIDDFNRAALGDTWTVWYNTLAINASTNLGGTTGSGNFNAGYYDSSVYGADSEVYATLTTKPSGTDAVCLNIRWSASAEGYLTAFAANTMQIYRGDGGAPTGLGSATAQVVNAGDLIGIECIGSSNNLKQYYKAAGGSWGQVGATISDNNYTDAGYLGVEMQDTAAKFDNFSGGTR